MLHCLDIPDFNFLGHVFDSELNITGILCASKNTVCTEYFKTKPGIYIYIFFSSSIFLVQAIKHSILQDKAL